MECGSLEEELKRQGTALKEKEALNILAMVALAIQQTHLQGRPHARISSKHVFYHSINDVQLAFPANLPASKWRGRWTVENYYFPPELQGSDRVYKGYKKDADIWAIGMLLVEMLTLNKPPLTYNEDGWPEG